MTTFCNADIDEIKSIQQVAASISRFAASAHSLKYGFQDFTNAAIELHDKAMKARQEFIKELYNIYTGGLIVKPQSKSKTKGGDT